MSLPSIVIFYKNGVEIERVFINCGWICNINTVKNGIKRALIGHDELDWDIAEAYGMSISKDEFVQEDL